MGIYDRDYNRPDFGGSGAQYMQMSFGLSSITPVVKWLLIINFAIFIIARLIPPVGHFMYTYGPVNTYTFLNIIQIWRYITYQFLHANVQHLVINLLYLYMFGRMVENAWGSKAFIKFYLTAGAIGGVFYSISVLIGILGAGDMVGASGAIFGVLTAAAILYPRAKVLVMFIFPMTLAWMVVLMIIFSLLFVLRGENLGGELAHLSGVAYAFLYLKYKPLLTQWRMKQQKGAWQRKVEQERSFQHEVDRILDKVNREGIQSLTSREKQILQEATRREQQSAGR